MKTVGDVVDPEVSTDLRTLWESRGLDAATLVQAPSISLRPDALPPPAPVPSAAEGPPLAMLKTLGEGGMGVVRLALQRALHREVAVKTTKATGGERARRALLSEALVTGVLQHPNIIPIHTVDEDESGAPVIVMKRVEGVSWHAMLHGEAPLPAESSADPLGFHLDVLAKVASAVEFAHRRGILHRDLKPENVMIGDLGELYVLDWGLAVSMREADRGLLPTTAEVKGIAGTPAYMAPEMTIGTGEKLGPHTDVYLLGAILHEVLTLSPRHVGREVLQVLGSIALSEPYAYPPDVPSELAAIANRATSREPEDRFPSADAFRSAILAFLRHRSSIALSDEAMRRVARMKEIVASTGATDPQQREVRDLFAAARFGFEQALDAWPENQAARASMRDAIETLVRFEIARRDVVAARAYLASLEEPPDELVRGVRALSDDIEAVREEYRRLRHTARDTDRTVGATRRAWMSLVFGGGAAASLVLIDWGDASGRMPLTESGYLGWLLVLAAATALFVRVFRSVMFANRVNKQILFGTLASLGAIAALRFAIVASEIPIRAGFRLELVLYGMGLAILAIVTNNRILVAAGLCALGAVVDAWLESDGLYVIAGALFFAFAAMSWAWASVGRAERTARARRATPIAPSDLPPAPSEPPRAP